MQKLSSLLYTITTDFSTIKNGTLLWQSALLVSWLDGLKIKAKFFFGFIQPGSSNAAYNQLSILTYDHLLVRAKNVLGVIDNYIDEEDGELPF